MTSPAKNIRIFATDWCYDCRRARKFFDRNQIPYDWINIDREPDGERFVLEVNNGMRSVPTIVFTDGTILVEPGEAALRAKLGLQEASA